MKRFLIAAAVSSLLASALAPRARGCTTFCLTRGDGVYFGKNYDWNIGRGYAFVNKRGVGKSALLEPPQRPASWVSKYGSLTFNQYGREQPHGGINEAGLVVELMWLDDAQYPAPDARPAVGVLDWVQYQLDNFSTVREVIEHGDRLRITSEVKLHYLVADRSGRAASVEFLAGKFVAHDGAALPYAALANDTYSASVAYLKTHAGFGGSRPLPRGAGSLERFARASALVRGYKSGAKQPPVDYAFEVLADVAQGKATQWSIVYDLKNLRAHFRTQEDDRRARRSVALSRFDFSCATPVKMLDMNRPGGAGDVSGEFRNYTREANRALIEFSFRNTPFLANVPAPALDTLAAFPENMPCRR